MEKAGRGSERTVELFRKLQVIWKHRNKRPVTEGSGGYAKDFGPYL